MGDRIPPPNSSPTPGPGSYSADRKVEAPSYSFGRKLKSSKSKADEIPGPGQYDARVKSNSPSPTFGTRPSNRPEPGPGPGSYGSPLKSSAPQYSLSGRLGSSSCGSPSPGPAAYSTAQHRPNGPSFSILRKPDMPTRECSPGPAAYAPNPDCVCVSFPKFSLSGGRHEPNALKERTPGPGPYDASARHGSPAYTLAERTEISKPNNFPGPGSYSVVARSSSPAFSLGARSGPPTFRIEALNPGPGSYDVVKPAASAAPAYTMSGKPQIVMVDGTPGPGSYTNPVGTVGKDAPSYSLASRRPLIRAPKEQNPGPGTYTLPSVKDGRSFSFSPKAREQGPDWRPGPGAYDLSFHCTRTASPSYHIGGRFERKPSEFCSPGPGAYAVQRGEDTPAFSILPRLKSPPPSHVPGPGSYDASHKQSSPSSPAYSLSGSLPARKIQQTPGPAEYNPKASNTRPPSYTISGKRQTDYARPVPGPGSYEASDRLISFNGGAFSMGSKLKDKKRETSPGPAAYDPKLPGSPSCSFHARPPDRSRTDSPGPGSYNITSSDNTRPSYSFGGRLEQQTRHATPGPAAYDVTSNANRSLSPSFTFGDSLPSVRISSVPGPGTYNATLTGTASPAFSMLGRQRCPAINQLNAGVVSPGPGAYSPEKHRKPEGPSYTLGNRPAGSNLDTRPGPGSYTPSQALRSPAAPSYSLATRLAPLLPVRSISPGPGAYSVKPSSDGPSFSISGKKPLSLATISPGPGAYSAQIVHSGGPAFSLSGRLKDRPSDMSPGPGAYDHNPPFKGPDNPALSFPGRASPPPAVRSSNSSPAPVRKKE